MEPTLILIIAFVATLFGGMAVGFLFGITKGVSLGARVRTGRPVSAIPWITCFIGAGVFLLTAVGSSVYSIYFLSNSIRASAVVTEIVERKDNEGRVNRIPVYTYMGPLGEEFSDRSSVGDSRGGEVGDAIPVRYLKNSPHQSRIDFFSHHWLFPIFMLIASILLCGLAVALRWWRNREQQWATKMMAAGEGVSS